MNSFAIKTCCRDCIGETYLKSLIGKQTYQKKCDYCSSLSQYYISIEELAAKIQDAIRGHFCATSDEPDCVQSIMMSDPECDYLWEREGGTVAEIVQDCALVDEQIASDVQECLDFDSYRRNDEYFLEREFDSEIRYQRLTRYRSHWHDLWRNTELELKNQTRFFSQNVVQTFDRIFDKIEDFSVPGSSIFRKFKMGASFYRARVFQTDESLKSALEKPALFLGPPVAKPASAGRMNAHGISVFYGSTSPKVALAEVRPPVGSRVAIAKFSLLRDVKLLDLRSFKKLSAKGSIFDSRYADRLGRAEFLRTFCEKITIPVMPGNEASEYLITQAIADYLSDSKRFDLDGIVYPSVQDESSKAINIVLFHKSARSYGSNDTIFDASLYDTDWEDGQRCVYSSYSLKPTDDESLPIASFDDFRNQTLKLEEDNLVIAHVTAAKFSTKDRSVSIRRK